MKFVAAKLFPVEIKHRLLTRIHSAQTMEQALKLWSKRSNKTWSDHEYLVTGHCTGWHPVKQSRYTPWRRLGGEVK
jgi:hypothetical protein